MTTSDLDMFTAFIGHDIVARGSRGDLVKQLGPQGPHPEGLTVFSDRTGRETDLNLTGVEEPARGRPKLGVKSREVTLLPRHWDWLARQRGGASAALRRLVDAAQKDDELKDARFPDRTYPFLTTMAGNRDGYEDALRALYAGYEEGFRDAMKHWPADIQSHALFLAGFE